MSTPCEIQLFHENKTIKDNCAKDILKECKRLEKKYNYYDNKSYLNEINLRKTDILDNETKFLLSSAKQYYKKTNGIFDITIATIKENKNLKNFVGCNNFSIKKNKIYFTNEFTKIDLGGFVKEYSVDNAVKIIKKYKIKSALVNFGGDIYALGLKPNKQKFSIGIKNPKNTSENLLSVEIFNEALTTSALYERKNHINSLNNLNNDILSSTVISSTCVNAGVYSTSFMINNNIKTNIKTILINKNLEVINENFTSRR